LISRGAAKALGGTSKQWTERSKHIRQVKDRKKNKEARLPDTLTSLFKKNILFVNGSFLG
jgi:hypothetical protein